MTNNLFIDINILQTVPSSNINRDDTGAPKTAIYGGVTRARVSSQSWKRAVRQAFKDETKDADWLQSSRTKKGAHLLAKQLQQLDGSLDDDAALDKAIAAFDAAKIKVKKDKKSGQYLTGALLLLSQGQLKKIAQYVLDHGTDNKLDYKDVKSILMDNNSLDLALFGRMVADNPELNVDAACQVAHAISTHEIVPEFDYFTAIDDERDEDQAGSAMIGTLEYDSATLYRYANINFNELAKNMGSELAIRGSELFIKDFVLSMPTGKENSFANKTLPQYVMISLRKDTPVNLVSAFENPVTSRIGYVQSSIDKLEKEFAATKKFVESPIKTIVLTADSTEISDQANDLSDLLAQVSALLQQEEPQNEESDD
ncbi:MAG: type I-E CRISPR-associated protein Cas7/Cse4/CasC [Lactobacillus sp.]|jgi:CRISPR system Cascade subunit CasC|nr:type I-E CRISPR-associated protein Cas7/Cse4/CasC [Lactobacillus sp.]